MLDAIKSITREVFPPILMKASKRILQPKLINVRFENYEDALSSCDVAGYENDQLVEEVIEKNIRFRKKLDQSKELNLEIARTLIPIAMIPREKSLTVLDFGGGGGYHYTLANYLIGSEVRLNWAVVETSEMTRQARILEDDHCKFFDSISGASENFERFDLVFTSAALQSCPEPLEFLKQLVSVGAKYLFITRTPTIESEDQLVAIQFSPLSSNGPGKLSGNYKNKLMKYPITYVSRSKFEEILTKDYDIKFTLDEGDLGYAFKNEPIGNIGYFCVRKPATHFVN